MAWPLPENRQSDAKRYAHGIDPFQVVQYHPVMNAVSLFMHLRIHLFDIEKDHFIVVAVFRGAVQKHLAQAFHIHTGVIGCKGFLQI